MRDFFETAAIYICGAVIVLMMTILYWGCRLCGIHLEEDF